MHGFGVGAENSEFDYKIHACVDISPEKALGFHHIFKPGCFHNPPKVVKGCSSLLKIICFPPKDFICKSRFLYHSLSQFKPCLFKPRPIPPVLFILLLSTLLLSLTCLLTKTSLQTEAFYSDTLILYQWLANCSLPPPLLQTDRVLWGFLSCV